MKEGSYRKVSLSRQFLDPNSLIKNTMRLDYLKILVCCLALTLTGCLSKGSPIVPVVTPSFVPQSSPDALVQTGIRQDPSTGGIFLQWYSVPSVAGYKIYRADTANSAGIPIDFQLIRAISSANSLSDTSISDAGLIRIGVNYYYYLTAYSMDGTTSQPSDTVEYELINRPQLHYPTSSTPVDGSSAFFAWYDATGGGFTVIRIEDISVAPQLTIWVSNSFQVFESYPTRTYNFDSTATSQLMSGHYYRWRVERFDIDGTGRPYEGSTSPWSTFSVK
ncbi:MAG: hypothetical protein M1378_13075 [Bacteroidetes bacterium]|nr:hypothetical protein [Bacteroidota bacterium]